MVKSFMFASQPNHASNRPRRLHPPDFFGFSLTSVNSVPSALKSTLKSTTVAPLNQKPLPHALFSLFSKNNEKLSPSFSNSSALFQKECSINSFPLNNFRTLSQNTGVGSPSSNQSSADRPTANYKSPVAASALSLPRVTSHQSQITKSFIIRTSTKHTRNPFRICTSKTKHLKPFRIRTYEKKGRGPATRILPPLGSPPS